MTPTPPLDIEAERRWIAARSAIRAPLRQRYIRLLEALAHERVGLELCARGHAALIRRVRELEAKERDCEAEHPPEPWAAQLQARADALEEALRAITTTLPSGQVCYVTSNGVPMGMPRKLERIARRALAPRGEEKR